MPRGLVRQALRADDEKPGVGPRRRDPRRAVEEQIESALREIPRRDEADERRGSIDAEGAPRLRAQRCAAARS